MKKTRPDFIIIGAMKSGTTTLFNYLATHPETNACTDKEPEYFGTNWERGPDWYASLFKQEAGLTFEASTSYTRYPSRLYVPERIKKAAPDCKLIYIIRNPVERIVSQLQHQITHRGMAPDAWYTKPDFWTRGGGKHAIDVSMYYTQLQRFLPHFERDRILVLQIEDLKYDPRQLFVRIASFLGIDTEPFDNISYGVFNQGGSTVVSSKPILSKIIKGLKAIPGLEGMTRFFGKELGKPELTDDQLQYIWDQLGDDLDMLEKFLGYSTGYTRPHGG